MEVRAIFNSPIQILDEKKFWYFLIVFTTAFNLFFLNTFVPFNINTWRNDTQLEQLIHLSGFALLGGTVLCFSHLFIRLLRIRSFVLQTYLVRYFVELLIMSVVFVIYQEGQWLPVSGLLKEVPISFKYSFLSTILPYSMSFLLFNHLRMKEKKIPYQEKLRTGMVDFPDEKNQIQFSICSDQINYIEAADNYLYIHCLENGQETRHLLRNTLKNMELHFAETGLKRCHRSFMVNLQRIRLVRYEKNKCLLYLNGIDQVIPVSRGYLAAFSEYIRP